MSSPFIPAEIIWDRLQWLGKGHCFEWCPVNNCIIFFKMERTQPSLFEIMNQTNCTGNLKKFVFCLVWETSACICLKSGMLEPWAIGFMPLIFILILIGYYSSKLEIKRLQKALTLNWDYKIEITPTWLGSFLETKETKKGVWLFYLLSLTGGLVEKVMAQV